MSSRKPRQTPGRNFFLGGVHLVFHYWGLVLWFVVVFVGFLGVGWFVCFSSSITPQSSFSLASAEGD